MKKSLFILIFLLSIPIFSLAVLASEQFHVTRYTTEQGLSQDAVRAIFQDKLGYIWIGTEEGLNRFDGKDFKQFRHQKSNPQSISSDLIYAIAGGRDDQLWIGTKGPNGGLNKYNLHSDKFDRFQHNDNASSLSGNNISCLFVDSESRLWVGTEKNGLNLLLSESNGGEFRRFSSTDGLSSNAIRSITEDDAGNIWVGTDDAGINIINPGNWQIKPLQQDESREKTLSSNAIRQLKRDKLGNIYVATAEGGLNIVSAVDGKITRFSHQSTDSQSLSSDRVLSVFQDRQNNIWVGTEHGLNLFRDGKFVRYFHQNTDQHSLSNNRILSIYQDKGDVIWIGTFAGLNKWNPNRARFSHLKFNSGDEKKDIAANIITHFSMANDKKVLIATYGAGVLTFDPAAGVFTSLTDADTLPDARIMTSLNDSQGGIWLGSRNAGISYLAPGETQWQQFNQEHGLPYNGITDILQDNLGQIWVTTYRGGLSRWHGDQKRFSSFSFAENEQPEKVYQLVQDKDDSSLWLVTGKGLYHIFPATGQYKIYANEQDDSQSLTSNHLLYFYQDSRGDIWLATHGGGLNLWRRQAQKQGQLHTEKFTIETGLSSNTIYGITEDKAGNIWFSGNRGISQLNVSTNKLKHYDKSHGLQDNDFNLAAVLRLSDGKLLFGGSNGFNQFDPEQIKDNQHVPQVQLSQILSLNKPLALQEPAHLLQQIDFEHDDYLVAFDFVGLDFAAPEKNSYRYQLQGFDPDWIDSQNHTRATYTNLPPGNYVFSVMAANNDGVWSPALINLPVTVNAALWHTWWAYLLYVLAFTGLIFYGLRLQANKLAREEEYNQKLSEQMKENELHLNHARQELQQYQKQLADTVLSDKQSGLKTARFLEQYVPLRLAKIDEQFIGKSALEITNAKINKLFIAIIRLDASQGEDISAGLPKLSATLVASCHKYDVITQWQANEFVVIGEREHHDEIQALVAKLSAALNTVWPKHHIGFSCYPFDNLSPGSINWEQVTLIANQALTSIQTDAHTQWLGLLGCRCESTELLFAEIMKSQALDQLAELLYLVKSNSH